MPWKECHDMDERLRFVARLLEGGEMTLLGAEFERWPDCCPFQGLPRDSAVAL